MCFLLEADLFLKTQYILAGTTSGRGENESIDYHVSFWRNRESMEFFIGNYSEKLLAVRKVFVYTKAKFYKSTTNFDEVTQFQPFISHFG